MIFSGSSEASPREWKNKAESGKTSEQGVIEELLLVSHIVRVNQDYLRRSRRDVQKCRSCSPMEVCLLVLTMTGAEVSKIYATCGICDVKRVGT